ncbi:MAG: flagellar basal-body rod protein FlgG [Deltaproteobacteria bacterium]|nr:flagellar basal-body rod protein FlgG [Deltaproteobacteria bacterium]MBW2050821.1 flagellar basal-body rod protein FlgG [Deltaproteobacteria bacterium]MBW2141023.1 flagellar basal-body rod protein FlgG [Deltaproteobacteria bacterium]MBW2322971.1 flagellar basal-body rod protein FlgG [Deltaproteobacteria bacterium]
MMRGLWTAATGMNAQQLNLDVIAHNLANVNTIGFKKSRPEFQDLIYQSPRAAGTETADGQQIPVGIQIGMGVKPIAVQKLFTQGDYQQTGQQLDLAIEGNGFFQLLRNGEDVYTRAGAFKLDSTGTIVDAEGNPLQPEFIVPEEAVQINIDSGGNITALNASGDELASTRITLVRFQNPAGLYAMGKNLFGQTNASGDPVEGNPGEEGYGTIAQGFIEMSNVDVVTEMVNMIVAQRAYEINSKAIQSSDEMLSIAVNVKR